MECPKCKGKMMTTATRTDSDKTFRTKVCSSCGYRGRSLEMLVPNLVIPVSTRKKKGAVCEASTP